MEIQINKTSFFSRIVFGLLLRYFFGCLGIYILNLFLGFDELVPLYILYSTYGVYTLGYAIILKIKINSLVYTIEEGRLTKEYQVFMKTKDSARLQVVNSVDIRQSFLDRLFDIFYLEVGYGFSGSGYHFTFIGLTEDEADRISKLIKPLGNPIEVK